jgi:hypothetical protein
MRIALLLLALLASPARPAEVERLPLEAARAPVFAAPRELLLVSGLPIALSQTLPDVPLPAPPAQAPFFAAKKALTLDEEMAKARELPAARRGLAETAALQEKAPDGRPIAALFDGIGAKPALAMIDLWKDPVRAPTPVEAGKLRIMKRMADAFLLKRDAWVPHKMAPVSPSNPGGFRGILVGDLGTAFGKYGDGVVAIDAEHLAKVPAAKLADTMLHELVHHLNPSFSGDEMLSHLYEAEFANFTRAWLGMAGLGYDLKPYPLLEPLRSAISFASYSFGFGQRSVVAAYRAGTMIDFIKSRYDFEKRWKDHPIGFPEGAASAVKHRALLQVSLAQARLELASDDGLDPEKTARLRRMIERRERDLDLYERVAIPVLRRYEGPK